VVSEISPTTIRRHCPVCRRDTEHVQRVRYERRNYADYRAPRQYQALQCMTCGREFEVLRTRETDA